MNRRYALITPCRDEAAYARRTLDSVVAQTVPPARWMIVDDGSTDGSPEILAEYAAKYPYIHIVRRQDRGGRLVGPGVIDAFYTGYDTITPGEFSYVCKFDLDLDLPPRYFESLIEHMESDPRLGTCSGKPYFLDKRTGRMISEKCGDDMSVGMTKFYRTTCFEEIGGFVREVMWDGIDCHRCRMLGWKAWSRDDEELRFIHLRPMGSSQQSIWTGRMRHGYGQYFMGSSLAYMTASALYRMTRPPFVVGGLAMWIGYVRAMLTGKGRYDDPAFRRLLRRYQWKALLQGKRRAIAAIEHEYEPVWRERHGNAVSSGPATADAAAQPTG